MRGTLRCARHGTALGGASPLYAVEIGSTSLGQSVYREVESEGSRRRNKRKRTANLSITHNFLLEDNLFSLQGESVDVERQGSQIQ